MCVFSCLNIDRICGIVRWLVALEEERLARHSRECVGRDQRPRARAHSQVKARAEKARLLEALQASQIPRIRACARWGFVRECMGRDRCLWISMH